MLRLIFLWLFCGCLLNFDAACNNSLIEIEQQLKSTNDSSEIVNLYLKAGKIYFAKGDFVNAQKQFFQALRIAEKLNDETNQGRAYNNIAASYMETGKYAEAKKYAQQAIAVFLKNQNYEELGNAYNSLANIYYMQELDSLALQYYHESIRYRKLANDSLGLFATLKNLGAIYYHMGDTLKAIDLMEQSVHYLTEKDDSARWFSAFMTLGELYVYAGLLEKGKQNLDMAALYISSAKPYHKLDDYHYALYRYYYAKGNYKNAIENYVKYEAYKDSIENLEKSRQLQELHIQYETEKKETKIKHQQQLLDKERQTKQLYVVIFITFLFLAFLLFLIYRMRQKRKTDLLLQQQNEKALREIFAAEQKERIRIARDLHDSIGQKLAVMKMLLPQPADHPDLKKVAAYLDETAAEVRNISHNLIPEILNFGLVKAIEGLADRINSTENIKVYLKSDETVQHLNLSKQTELSLYRIVQEILSNIIRHSKTSSIMIELTKFQNFLQLIIKDNGVGFEPTKIDESQGLGWKNIFARIRLINGEIKIQSERNKGSNFFIYVPIA